MECSLANLESLDVNKIQNNYTLKTFGETQSITEFMVREDNVNIDRTTRTVLWHLQYGSRTEPAN